MAKQPSFEDELTAVGSGAVLGAKRRAGIEIPTVPYLGDAGTMALGGQVLSRLVLNPRKGAGKMLKKASSGWLAIASCEAIEGIERAGATADEDEALNEAVAAAMEEARREAFEQQRALEGQGTSAEMAHGATEEEMEPSIEMD